MNKFINFFKIKRTYFYQGEGIVNNRTSTFSGVCTHSSIFQEHHLAFEKTNDMLEKKGLLNFHLNKFWRVK